MTIIELRNALTEFRRAHGDRLPAEPLHFTLDQWREFLLEPRARVIELCKADGTPQRKVLGMRVVLHLGIEALTAAHAQDSSPELWNLRS